MARHSPTPNHAAFERDRRADMARWTEACVAKTFEGGAGSPVQRTIEKPVGTAQLAGACELSLMRYQESAERIGTLVVLEIFRGGQHARGPGIERIITGERLCQLPGAVHRQRLCGFGGLTWPNHTRTQNKKSPLRKSLRACRAGLALSDVDFDTVNFGSDIGFSRNVKSACGIRLT
jgi:hypothetical protein